MESKLTLLHKVFGHHSFRGAQEPVIDALLAGRDALCIMPTGAGKSVCYQIPALLLPGITIIVSPLISLMADQVAALRQADIPAAYLNSSLTPGQCRTVLKRLAAGCYRLIYVAPERLMTPGFLSVCQNLLVSMIAVDEAHCVSQWGQDFRPAYLRIPEFAESLPNRPVMAAFTATATDEVKRDIERLLHLCRPAAFTTGFDRPNLYFGVKHTADKDAELLRIVSSEAGHAGIVYCATRKAVDEVCALLCANGIRASRYHAGMTEDERRQSQEDFVFDRTPVMVATNAFGMGIDKSDVRFVVHYHMPKNPESYYQEAGRAGRDGENASCILLYAPQDVRIAKFLIENGEPNPALPPEAQEAVRKKELARLGAMQSYCREPVCLRRNLLRYFGEHPKELHCGNCSVCLEASARQKTAERLASARKERPAERIPGGHSAGREALPDAPLMSALRILRTSFAAKEHVPAYIIFPDSALADMCRKKPASMEQFLTVAGVGEAKAKKYGEAFLRVIRQYS